MSKVVSQDPEVLGGEPVFVGTRVPVKSLFDHLEAGDSIEDFLRGFPGVKREHVLQLLKEARTHAVHSSSVANGRRSRFPIFPSRSPGSLHLTATDLAELESKEDARLNGGSP
jgi:uncharacterized protein (DUF433 family)